MGNKYVEFEFIITHDCTFLTLVTLITCSQLGEWTSWQKTKSHVIMGVKDFFFVLSKLLEIDVENGHLGRRQKAM